MNFKQFIRIKRIENSRTISDDAKDFDKSISYLSIMETGKQPISTEYIEYLCSQYEVGKEEIYNYLRKEVKEAFYCNT